MLGYAKGRLPVARADGRHLPLVSSTLPAVITVMAHTDPRVMHHDHEDGGRLSARFMIWVAEVSFATR